MTTIAPVEIDTSDLISSLGKVSNVQFANVTYRAKGTGELARHQLILGASTENQYDADLAKLREMLATETDPLMIAAIRFVIGSREESLAKGIGNNSDYTCKDTYHYLPNLPGVMVHIASGDLHIRGLSQHKTVIEPGTYKRVNSSAQTIARNKVRKELPSSRIRQFAFSNITRLAAAGDVLEIE